MWRQDDVFAILNATAATRYDPARGPGRRGPAAVRGSALPPAVPAVRPARSRRGRILRLRGARRGRQRRAPATPALRRRSRSSTPSTPNRSPICRSSARPTPGRWSSGCGPSRGAGRCRRCGSSPRPAWSCDPRRAPTLLGFCPNAICVDILGSSEAPQLGRSRSTRTEAAQPATFEPGPNVRVVDEDGRDVVARLGRGRSARHARSGPSGLLQRRRAPVRRCSGSSTGSGGSRPATWPASAPTASCTCTAGPRR